MLSPIRVLARLSFGLIAITAAAGILLLSDLDARRDRRSADDGVAAGVRRVALVQLASVEPVDQGIRGILAGLEARGFVDGERLEIMRYNAQGDIAVANAIASQVTSADLDMIITATTPSLQTVANANRSRTDPIVHIFGITSDPYAAGVGISSEDHLDHPPYMAGLGSLPAVRELFELLRTINPDLRRVGLVWNPAEANSEAATRLARDAAAEFGMELVEGNADSSTAAGEVAQAVISRGVDVLWLSPDTTVYTAIDALIQAARREGVPVVTSIPGSISRGSLLDLGARYEDIGYVQGIIAADVLEGRDPATIPVENWIPVDLHLNLTELEGLSPNWRIDTDIVESASVVIDASGTREQELERPEPPPFLRWDRAAGSGKRPNVDLVMHSETTTAEQALEGFKLGLAEGGFDPDRALNLRVRSAQGDMPILVSIFDAISPTSTELIVTLSTPALQTAMQRDRGIPVVTFNTNAAEFGPLVIVGRDYVDSGIDSGRLAARVLRGESVAALPFKPASTTRYILNQEAARSFRVTFSDELLSLPSRGAAEL